MKIEKIKNIYWVIGIVISMIITLISITWKISKYHENLKEAYNEILATSKINEQMALKSIIWNENVPELDRISACDTYIERGFNSVTKKYCEQVLKDYKYKEIV